MRGSVIVPVRNGSGVITSQLDALREQAARNDLEVLIVDDASTDDTASVIAAWITREGSGRFRLIRRSARGGPNAARNAGIASATADFLLFCDGDDVVDARWSDALLGARDDSVILCGALRAMSTDTAQAAWELPPTVGAYEYAYGGNMAVARSVVDRVGGFEENIVVGGSELDFAVRASMADVKVRAVPDAVVNYRLPTSGWGRFTWQFEKERGRAYLRRTHGAEVLPRDWRQTAAAWGKLLVLLMRATIDRRARLNAGDLAGRLVGRAVWTALPHSVLVNPARKQASVD